MQATPQIRSMAGKSVPLILLINRRPHCSNLAANLAARKISGAGIGRGNAIICVDVDVHPAGPDCRN